MHRCRQGGVRELRAHGRHGHLPQRGAQRLACTVLPGAVIARGQVGAQRRRFAGRQVAVD
jgi:hypothetical protein